MNSFIENVNYVAGLDNRYGRSVEIFKNNLSLRTESYDVKIKFTYYNYQTSELIDVFAPYNAVSISGFEGMLNNFKSQINALLGGNKFICTSTFSYTDFAINNVATVDIKINSLDDMIKTYGLNITITSGSNELYNINGVVNDTLKILPSVALFDSESLIGIKEINNNIVGLNLISSNINEILLANDNAISVNENAIIASNSATSANASATASSTSATNSANSATDAASSAAMALEYKESINPSIFNLKISTQQFDKPTRGPLFVKVSPSSIKIPAGLKITVGTESFKVLTDYTLTLASNLVGSTKTAGTDYYVYAKSNSTFYISANDAITTDRLIGGFHYGLVGETETATGNKLEADMVKIRGINQYSFWDLKYRPVASTKGMVKIGSEWYDIYLLNSEHIANGTSKAGLTIAGGITNYGRAIPKIPLEYGGNNTLNYGKFTWFQACEIAKANAKRLISYSEFPTIAYGVLEGVSSSTNAYETVAGKIEHYPNLTSKFGIEQATGVQNIYGDDLMNGYGTTSFASNTTNTDSRGFINATANSPTAVVLSGSHNDGVNAGSRASSWSSFVWNSNWSIGCRFACGHLELV